RRHVRGGEDGAVAARLGFDLLGQRTSVERGTARLGDQAQGMRGRGAPERLSGLWRTTAGHEVIGKARLIFERFTALLPEGGDGRGNGEAAIGIGDRGLAEI